MNPQGRNITALITLFVLSSAQLSFCVIDFHDILPTYNLPKGLIPGEIKSYSLSTEDNTFTIELSSNPCNVRLTDLIVSYDKIVKGKLGFGKVSDVSGIHLKKLVLSATVTKIEVVEKNSTVAFDVGFFAVKISVEDFETVHNCQPKGVQELGYAMRAVV